MITLRQLRYLSALARHGHFGRAAEACSVTQPALSMQIRDLERTLGVAVVERRPGEVTLTDVGREIARRGEDVLTASRDLVEFARHRRGRLTGRLTLGVIPSLAPYLLPRILPVLQSRFPDLRLELRETQTRPLLEDIKSGALDAAMLALPVAEPDVDTMALFDDLFLLAVPASDPRTANARVAVADIDQSRLILPRGRALSARPGAGILRDGPAGSSRRQRRRHRVRRQQFEHGDSDGRGRLRRHADSANRRRRRAARRAGEIFSVWKIRNPGRSIGLVFRRTSPRQGRFRRPGRDREGKCGRFGRYHRDAHRSRLTGTAHPRRHKKGRPFGRPLSLLLPE